MNKCNIYDYETYFTLTTTLIPQILKDANKVGIKFAVKGGKAISAYLKYKISSPDWDLIVPNKIESDKLYDLIINTFKTKNLTPNINNCVIKTYKIIQIGLESVCDIYMIDIANIDNDIEPTTIIDDIPYISINNLVKDLDETVKDRKKAFDNSLLSWKNIDELATSTSILNISRCNLNIESLLEKINEIKCITEEEKEKIQDDISDIMDLFKDITSPATYKSFIDQVLSIDKYNVQKIKLDKTIFRQQQLEEAGIR